MLKFCSIFNILVGVIAVLLCVGLSALAIGLGGGQPVKALMEATLVMGPIGIAGIFYSWSGVLLWKSLPAIEKKSVLLTGITWLVCLMYCSTWFVNLNGRFGVGGKQRQPGDSYDEEVVMFVFIPTAMLLFIAIEFLFLLRKMKQLA